MEFEETLAALVVPANPKIKMEAVTIARKRLFIGLSSLSSSKEVSL
ncbi:hypothetical protein [Bacillus sp. KH172YL63]|nr:hypothetical protein [Bacillus sp. KH172YL63]BCB05881.1 hypothetical protein KH172YL63_40140 [Bacillus sp. KH172YL63]